MNTDEEILRMLPDAIQEIDAAADAYEKAARDRKAITASLKSATDQIRAARARFREAFEL